MRRRAAAFAPSDAPTDAAATAPSPARRLWRYGWPILTGTLLGLLIALLVGVVLALRWDGVYPGVRAGAADLSGADRPTAAAIIAAEAARWEGEAMVLTGPAGTLDFARHDLGFSYDQEAALAAALAQGRGGNLFTRLAAIAGLAWGGRDLAAPYRLDEATLRARIGELAGATDISPQDGDLRIEAGRVVVTPPIEGRGLDVEAAVALVRDAATAGGPATVALPVAERIQPRLDAVALDAARGRAEAILATPLALRGDDLDLTFDAATIGSWLTIRRATVPGAAPVAVEPDPARVRAAVAPLAGRVWRDTRNAAYEYDERRRAFVVTVPALEGRRLDTDRTVAAIVAALDGGGDGTVAPVADRWRPSLTDGDIAVASRLAERGPLAAPLVLVWDDQRRMLTVPELAEWVTIVPGWGAADGPRVVLDEGAIAAYLAGLGAGIDRPAVDATYTMDDGTDFYRVTGPSQVGRALDRAAALKGALAALSGGKGGRVVALPIGEVRPKVTEADVANMVPERWIDVDLTTQRMYAVVGKKVVYTAVISSGKKGWETPTGTFHIIYRVENETMTSESIGAEENYRLENVLYTQYFTNEGHALHYSWWKPPGSFGIPSSHGCLSETLKDAEYFWHFADVGTRVTIHGRAPIR